MTSTNEPAEPHAVSSSWGRRYVVEAHLGTVGHQSAFAARDAALRRPVILVVQEGSAEERAAFLERARLLARHDLGHAVELFDCAVGDERAVVVTERPVASFAEVVASSSLTPDRRRSIAVALGAALASFHRAGIDPVGLSPHTVGFDEGGDLRVSAWPVTSFSAPGADASGDDRAALAAMVGSLGATPAWRHQLVDSATAAYEGVGEPEPLSPVPVTAPVPVVGPGRSGNPPTAQLQRVGAVAPPPPPPAPTGGRLQRRAALAVAAAVAVLAMAAEGALAASRHHAAVVQVGAPTAPKPAPQHALTTTTSPPSAPPTTTSTSPAPTTTTSTTTPG